MRLLVSCLLVALGACGSIESAVDSGFPSAHDAAGPGLDAAGPGLDASTSLDASPSNQDASVIPADAAAPGIDAATPPDASMPPDAASPGLDAAASAGLDASSPLGYDAGASSDAPCTFNADCIPEERCECTEVDGCFCKRAPRGTGLAGVDPCNDGNDCATALCVEGWPAGSFYCSGPCDPAAPTTCGPQLPRCIYVSFLGDICARKVTP